MALDSSLVGRTFGPTDPYHVTADRVAEFAAATGTPYRDGDPAPTTFPIVVSFTAMGTLMTDPSVGIELHRVIHGDQRFTYTRPVRVGDTLIATLTVDSVRSIGGNDIIVTTSAISDPAGEPICQARGTLIHRGGAA